MAKPAAKPVQKVAAAPEKPKFQCTVFDQNATDKARIHDVAGRKYKLLYEDSEWENGCLMPMADALFFLRHASFRVYDPDGNLMQTVITNPIAGAKLEKHQVIATLYELNRNSLLKRCQSLQGGNAFNQNTPSERLVDFLLESGKPTQRVEGPHPASQIAQPEEGDVADDDVDVEMGSEDGGKGEIPPGGIPGVVGSTENVTIGDLG